MSFDILASGRSTGGSIALFLMDRTFSARFFNLFIQYSKVLYQNVSHGSGDLPELQPLFL